MTGFSRELQLSPQKQRRPPSPRDRQRPISSAIPPHDRQHVSPLQGSEQPAPARHPPATPRPPLLRRRRPEAQQSRCIHFPGRVHLALPPRHIEPAGYHCDPQFLEVPGRQRDGNKMFQYFMVGTMGGVTAMGAKNTVQGEHLRLQWLLQQRKVSAGWYS